MRRLAALLLALALAGCGDDPPPPPAEVVLDDFCIRYTVALCESLAPCGCAMEDAITCGARLGPECPLHGPNRTAIDEGRIVYDPAGAGRWIERIAGAGCDLADLRAEATPYDWLGGFGAIAGTLEPGAECNTNEASCRRGTCRAGTCLGFSAEGEPCDVDPTMPVLSRICVADVPGDPPPRDRSIRCVPDAAGSATGRCLLVLPDGMPCTGDQDCASGRCAGTCMPRADLGAACTTDSACLSAHCDFSTGRCARPAAEGDLCTEDEGCATGWCDRPMELLAGNCRLRSPLGGGCTEHAACESGYCNGMNLCAQPICGL